jgi:hypothetical protein
MIPCCFGLIFIAGSSGLSVGLNPPRCLGAYHKSDRAGDSPALESLGSPAPSRNYLVTSLRWRSGNLSPFVPAPSSFGSLQPVPRAIEAAKSLDEWKQLSHKGSIP